MIKTLEIHNFKSIKDLTLPCRRFNLFIGEPNTGKSNLLEALGLLSFISIHQHFVEVALAGFVRHERTSNLFYDDNIESTLSIRCDEMALELAYRNDLYRGQYCDSSETLFDIAGGSDTIAGIYPSENARNPAPVLVQFYRFPAATEFEGFPREFLTPPYGINLPLLLVQNRELRHAVNLLFLPRGLRLGLRPRENKIELVKSFDDDIIISYPYSLASDTLQRLTFYTAAILTNRDSALVFEEPEAHSFPNHTKYLAEQIALDEQGNQYFIATHNPYFLMPLLSKAGQDDIAINIVYYEDYQTKVKTLQQEDLPELFELNIFANLDRYIES